jgi:hypothetical protein
MSCHVITLDLTLGCSICKFSYSSFPSFLEIYEVCVNFAMFVLNVWQGGLAPIDLKVETYFHRAAPGGTGGVKTISNYAPVSFHVFT